MKIRNKLIILFFGVFGISNSVRSQITEQDIILAWQKQFSNKWFNEQHDNDSIMLIGKRVPDFLLKTTLNNNGGRTKLSDFKGKLVILDFWSTNCPTCIASWPRMEQLQKEFGDKIQILLVNVFESVEEIKQRLSKMKIDGKALSVSLPNLPMLTGPREDLQNLFPHRALPYHVWIDSDQTVRVMGMPLNTNEVKINELLNGKSITSIPSPHNSAPVYDSKVPYYQMMGKSIRKNQYNSFFFPYNNYVFTTGNPAEGILDSGEKVIRNSYINLELVDIYYYAFRELSKQLFDGKVIFTPHKNKGGAYAKFDFFDLRIPDTLQLTCFFLEKAFGWDYLSDVAYVKSQVSYEQIVPQSTTIEEQKKRMIEDLNNHFGKLYGIEGHLEKRSMPVYILIRTSKANKLSSQKSMMSERKSIGGKIMRHRVSSDLGKVITEMIGYSGLAKSFSEESIGPKYILDETGIPKTEKVEVYMPLGDQLSSIDDLKNALKPYDLDIVEAERSLYFLVIKERIKMF